MSRITLVYGVFQQQVGPSVFPPCLNSLHCCVPGAKAMAQGIAGQSSEFRAESDTWISTDDTDPAYEMLTYYKVLEVHP